MNAGDVFTPATSEWVVAAILASQRDFVAFFESRRAQVWDTRATRTLAGATVLLVGYGSVARAVETRLSPFGCRFLRIARRARGGVSPTDALPELLPQADIVVLLVPLTSETRGLVSTGFLRLMRDQTLLVNASRGAVVDTNALLFELGAGRLRAALDVTDPEPLPPGHPLWSAPGLLLTPHVAGVFPGLRARQVRLLVDRLAHWAAGGSPVDVVAGRE